MSKRPVELCCINAHQPRDESLLDEPAGELGGVETPNREERVETGLSEKPLAIGADISQKEIAERYRREAGQLAFCALDGSKKSVTGSSSIVKRGSRSRSAWRSSSDLLTPWTLIRS